MPDREQVERYRAIGIGLGDVGIGERAAVLVVDFQRAFVEEPLGTPTSGEALRRTALLLDRARALGLPVVYARVVYDDPAQAGIVWTAKCPAMAACLRGTPAVEIHPLVRPLPHDRVIDKRRASAFFATPLHAELQSLGIDSLLIAGTSTSGCVRATAVDAAQLDYRVTVVEDCVEDRATASHEASLTDIAAKYGDVAPLEVLLDRLAVGVP